MKRSIRIAHAALLLFAVLGTNSITAQEVTDASTTQATSAALALRGIPTGKPAKRQTLTPEAFTALLDSAAPGLLRLAGAPKCTVDIYSLGYRTIGGRNEPTTAATAVMIPSGDAAACRGPRPVVLIAHGTSVDKNYDLASMKGDINGQNEGLSSAAIFAAQGFIVVLPNYAGYAGSTLGYAPFLNGAQQSADMLDALRASRLSFGSVAVNSILGKLFVTGYSQGGYVAMATERAMQNDPLEFHVAAAATGSGPYATSLLVDKEVEGAPSALAPLLFDLIATSWQKSYGNVYRQPSDMYAPQYAAQAQGLLPGTVRQSTLFAENVLPVNALFQTGSQPPTDVSNPDTTIVNETGFAPEDFFLNTSFRDELVADIAANPCSTRGSDQKIASCAPTTGLRLDAMRNDLLDFVPKIPLQMCGAHSDSLVYFFNTQVAAQYFKDHGMPSSALTVIDVDPGTDAPAGPFAALQAGFAEARAQEASTLGNSPSAALTLAEDVHTLAAPFCVVAARNFFQTIGK
jgi:alpha/beta superfamily hydrolase